jgi:hypothetical protein
VVEGGSGRRYVVDEQHLSVTDRQGQPAAECLAQIGLTPRPLEPSLRLGGPDASEGRDQWPSEPVREWPGDSLGLVVATRHLAPPVEGYRYDHFGRA